MSVLASSHTLSGEFSSSLSGEEVRKLRENVAVYKEESEKVSVLWIGLGSVIDLDWVPSSFVLFRLFFFSLSHCVLALGDLVVSLRFPLCVYCLSISIFLNLTNANIY